MSPPLTSDAVRPLSTELKDDPKACLRPLSTEVKVAVSAREVTTVVDTCVTIASVGMLATLTEITFVTTLSTTVTTAVTAADEPPVELSGVVGSVFPPCPVVSEAANAAPASASIDTANINATNFFIKIELSFRK